jgi:DHA1 family bicyclomycin/chloramphenicol resistance-like MFS transporter
VTHGSRRLLLMLGALSAVGPASMDIYLPALPALADDFGTSAGVAQLTVAAFLTGLGAGQLTSGALSDAFGRRRPLLVALACYAAASVVCALAPTIAVLIAGRLAQGVCAAAGIVISRAIVRDLYTGVEGARYLSRMVLIYGLAPLAAPVVGAQLLHVTDWRGLFYALAAASLVLLAVVAARLPETHPSHARQPAGAAVAGRAIATLLRTRPFVGYALALGLASAVMISYISASAFVVQDVYGASAQTYSLVFALGGGAMIAGSQLNAHLVGRFRTRSLVVIANAVAIAAGVGLLAAVEADVGLWMVVPWMVLLMSAWGFVPANIIALAMADHARIAGSASAVLGVFQYGMGGAVAPLVGAGGRHTALPMAVSVLALSVLAALAVLVLARPASEATGEPASAAALDPIG